MLTNPSHCRILRGSDVIVVISMNPPVSKPPPCAWHLLDLQIAWSRRLRSMLSVLYNLGWKTLN